VATSANPTESLDASAAARYPKRITNATLDIRRPCRNDFLPAKSCHNRQGKRKRQDPNRRFE